MHILGRLLLLVILALAPVTEALAQTQTFPAFVNGSATASAPFGPTDYLPLVSGAVTKKYPIANLVPIVNARDYGVSTGTSDNASALNTFFALFSTPNLDGWIPAGVYNFKSALIAARLNSSTLRGSGVAATRLNYTGTSTTIDLFTIGGSTATNHPYLANIYGVGVTSDTTMTDGTAIRVKFCRLCNIDNIGSWYDDETAHANTIWNGIWIDQPDMVRLTNIYVLGQNDCLRVSAKGTGTSFQYDLFVNGGKLGLCAAGIHEGGGVDNAHFDDLELTHNTDNVLIDNAIEAFKNQEAYFGTNVVTDQATNHNYHINDALADCTNYCIISISGPITGAGTNGVYVQSCPNCQVSISSPYINFNGNDGVHIADSSAHVAISTATYITNNGQYGIASEFAWSNLHSVGVVYGNSLGSFNVNVSGTAVCAGAISSNFATNTAGQVKKC